MTKRLEVPFNIKLLSLTSERLKNLKPVTVLDIFNGSTTDFHEDGLFSVSIFGRAGDERRNRRFSYINVKVPILHPVIFDILVKMKRLYGDILSGTGYARWDAAASDYVKATALDGFTGYEFFLSHWKEINFGDTKSTTRDQSVKLIKKYQDDALTSNIIVMPAGLRDLEVDEHNRKSEDEINTLYRRLIALSNSVSGATVRNDIAILNGPRYQMQVSFNNIYDYVKSLIEGKRKLLLGGWASRKVFNGTRNVITAADTSVSYLGAKGNPDINTTIIGMYQFLKASEPVSKYLLRQLVNPVFLDADVPTLLVNKDSLEAEEVLLPNRYFSQWTTNAGIEKIISNFQEETIRNNPVIVNDRYLFLIYRGPDMTFRLMRDIRELPAARSKQHVHPITYTELMFIAVYQKANRYPVLVTRYPVEGAGSIYPSHVHLRTTLKFEQRKRLGEDWMPMAEEFNADEYPVLDSAFVNSLIPHSSRLVGLGADYDGDTCSANVVYSEEAIAECENYFESRQAYVGVNGEFTSKTGVSTVNLVLANMTGD